MFNLSKNKIKKVAQVPYSKMLNEQNKEWSSTLDDVTPNLNGLLDEARNNDDIMTIHEANLEDVRKKADHSDQITESQIENRDSYVIHRNDKNDKVSIKPMDVLSEAYDQQYREAYKEAENSEKRNTEFWDKYVGSQLIGKKTKVPVNVPASGNQLSNNSDRFESLQGEGYHADVNKNFSAYKKDNNIRPMTMAQVQESLRDADAMLFFLSYKAAQASRPLTVNEQKLVDSINKAKTKILLAADPTIPSNPFEPTSDLSPQQNEESPISGDDMGLGEIAQAIKNPTVDNPAVVDDPSRRAVDFMDQNPTVEAPVPNEGVEQDLGQDMNNDQMIGNRYQQYEQSVYNNNIAEDETPF